MSRQSGSRRGRDGETCLLLGEDLCGLAYLAYMLGKKLHLTLKFGLNS